MPPAPSFAAPSPTLAVPPPTFAAPSPSSVTGSVDGGSAAKGRRGIAVVCVLLAASLLATWAYAYSNLRSQVSALRSEVAALSATEDVRLSQLEQDGQLMDRRLSDTEHSLNRHPQATQIAHQARRSVFTVITPVATGSGFVISSHRGRSELVTNFHVVADSYDTGERGVVLRRGGAKLRGTIVDVAEESDLALIRLRRSLPSLNLQRQPPPVGQQLLALGSPLGLGGTVTSGIVSAFRTFGGVEYMQFSAPVSPGNSGGPLLNVDGEVVGVTVQKVVLDGAEGLGFAIPSARVCRVLDVCR
jgi:S1-C subfamily serine protease